jgi:RNA polymerase sigma-70 factor (ECF subfamily)
MARRARLMEAYCNGDARAFRPLYDAAAPRLRAYLMRLTRDSSLTDDLFQEAFLKIHDARFKYARGTDPLPWFFTIARRLFLDHRRSVERAHRYQSLLTEETRTIADPELYGEPSLEVEPIGDEWVARVRRAVKRLPRNQREAIESTHMAGRTPRAVAPVLGLTPGALRQRLQRGLSRLRGRFATSRSAAARG